MKKIPYSFFIPIVYILYQHYCEKEDYLADSKTVIYSYNNVSKSNFPYQVVNLKKVTTDKAVNNLIHQSNGFKLLEKNHELHDILLKPEDVIAVDSLKIIEDDDAYIESPSSCHSLSIQLDTQLDKIKSLERIANRSNTEEGYMEARDIKVLKPCVFIDPINQLRQSISFKISVGTVGFAHSHTLSGTTRGFYSDADVKVFLQLAYLTYENIKKERIKTYSLYDLYSILIYGNQIYSMKIDNISLYKKFHENENNIKIRMMNRLDIMYRNADVHFNFFKDNTYSFPDENKDALNELGSKVLSKIGVRIYRLENYDKKNKIPRWRKLLTNENGNGIFVNPC
ncbi:hypothetical protein [Chishuiella changwenlii]|uniref:hypothetical protein n=1 Tax=Chishuiella changwenlii TaxID=1434701 RepID=UPI002FD94775